MRPLFSRNIGNTGRLVRSLAGLALIVGAGFGFFVSVWLGAMLAVSWVSSFCLKPCAAGA
jgi:hypothetical protein